MVLKLISCEVFFREISLCAAVSPHTIDVELTEKGAHDKSEELRGLIQSKIDAAQASHRKYDAVLLGYGLCGNSTAGLMARDAPLVIPRAHDCCTLFLGSRTDFSRYFKDNPSLPFSSTGYMERGGAAVHEASALNLIPGGGTLEDLISRYGEENGRYVFETLTASEPGARDNRVLFIDVPELSPLGFAERCRSEVEATGKRLEVVAGDIRLIRRLVEGQWDPDEFLIVPPGRRIRGVYDWDAIMGLEDS